MDELQQQWNHLAKACHTLQWLTVDEQESPPPCQKLALACVIMEGHYHAATDEIAKRGAGRQRQEQVQSNRRKQYTHMSVYALRQDAPYEKNGWQIIGGIGGLPATGYVPRFDPVPKPEDVKQSHEELVVQRLGEEPDFDKHDVLFVNEVRADHEIGDRFHGWEVIMSGRGL